MASCKFSVALKTSIPFIAHSAKSLPSSPVKPHEAVPLSEFGGRAEKGVTPEVVQSWRRETFLNTDISQEAPTSGFTSPPTETGPLAHSTPILITSSKSQQQLP